VILTRTFIITALLLVVLLFTNDFVTMSIATAHVSASPTPDLAHLLLGEASKCP
jgi:H+-transporting ATPase